MKRNYSRKITYANVAVNATHSSADNIDATMQRVSYSEGPPIEFITE